MPGVWDTESEDSDEGDGIFTREFRAKTGIDAYLGACRAQGVRPVQQLVAEMDREELQLKHRGVGWKGGVALFECLRHNKCFQTVDLDDNQLGLCMTDDPSSLDAMSSALRENDTITALDLSNNNISSMGCAAVGEALVENCTLVELSIRGNNIADSGFVTLAQALAQNTTLTKLDVSHNLVGVEGIRALASAVQENRTLAILDLSWNFIRAECIPAVADLLLQSAVVRCNLAWNGLGNKGAEDLARVLAQNPELQYLDLSKTGIEDTGLIAIAEALRVNTTLVSLHLRGNPVKRHGVGALLQAIGVNCTVRDVGLQSLCLDRSGVGLFDRRNPTGKFLLDLSDSRDRTIVEEHRELDRQDEASGIDNFLNVTLNGTPVAFADGEDIQTWTLPPQGMLAYDYVSGKRTPQEARPMRENVFSTFSGELVHLDDEERLVQLRFVTTSSYFAVSQAKDIVHTFSMDKWVDAAVILFRRLVDPRGSTPLWETFTPAMRRELHRRLGTPIESLLPAEDKVKVFLTQVTAEPANPLLEEFNEVWAKAAGARAHLAAATVPVLGVDGAEEAWAACREVFWTAHVKLRAVFKYYAAADSSEADPDVRTGRMTLRALWTWCRICHLPAASMPLTHIDRLFVPGGIRDEDEVLRAPQKGLGMRGRGKDAHSRGPPRLRMAPPSALRTGSMAWRLSR